MSDHAPAATAETAEQDIHIDYWEGIWIRISFVVLTIFVVAILVAAFAFNIQLPGVTGRVDPNNLDAPGSPFAAANLGARELAPGVYEVYAVAQALPWQFNGLGTPDFDPLTLPAGSDVKFYVTSRDVQHGFKVVGTNINMMLLPGQISRLQTRFDTPGEYEVICHEYCGEGHQGMWAKIVITAPSEVEAEGAATDAQAEGATSDVEAEGAATDAEASDTSDQP